MQLPTVETKISEFDTRLSRIEGIVEQIGQRLTSLENRITNLENRVDNGFRDLQNKIFWLIGIQVTTILSLGTLILFKLG